LKYIYPIPFAWQSLRSHHGAFRLDEQGKIQVNFDGKRKVRLARHDLLLQPGQSYRIETQFERKPLASDNLYWNLICHGSGKPIMQSRFLDSDRNGGLITSFVIADQNCTTQRLILLGNKRDETKLSQLTILDITISKMGEF